MKSLDQSRPFATVCGQAAHKYEQDGKKFDHQGVCMDDAGYKAATSAQVSARDVRTTSQADPALLEQINAQTGIPTAGETGSGQRTELETLGLTAKVMASLRGAEVGTVEALCRCTEAQLIGLPNIGEGTVKAIKKALKAAGAKLAG
jgi:DNA-directed RNA polymerase alpha subunit